MYPISIHDGQHIDFDNLTDLITRICNDHRSNNRAIAFAFILYDFTNENISKILLDEIYWQSLNKLSGNLLTVFYINSNKPEIKAQTIKLSNKNDVQPVSSLNTNCWMTGIKYEQDPEVFNGLIKEAFNIDKDIDLPAILFFQVNRDNITDFFVIELKEDKIEETFLEVKGHVKSAISSLKLIDNKYYDNTTEIFEALKTALINRNQRIFIGRVARLLPIGKFLRLFIKEI